MFYQQCVLLFMSIPIYSIDMNSYSFQVEEELLTTPHVTARISFDHKSGHTVSHYKSRQKRRYSADPPEVYSAADDREYGRLLQQQARQRNRIRRRSTRQLQRTNRQLFINNAVKMLQNYHALIHVILQAVLPVDSNNVSGKNKLPSNEAHRKTARKLWKLFSAMIGAGVHMRDKINPPQSPDTQFFSERVQEQRLAAREAFNTLWDNVKQVVDEYDPKNIVNVSLTANDSRAAHYLWSLLDHLLVGPAENSSTKSFSHNFIDNSSHRRTTSLDRGAKQVQDDAAYSNQCKDNCNKSESAVDDDKLLQEIAGHSRSVSHCVYHANSSHSLSPDPNITEILNTTQSNNTVKIACVSENSYKPSDASKEENGTYCSGCDGDQEEMSFLNWRALGQWLSDQLNQSSTTEDNDILSSNKILRLIVQSIIISNKSKEDDNDTFQQEIVNNELIPDLEELVHFLSSDKIHSVWNWLKQAVEVLMDDLTGLERETKTTNYQDSGEKTTSSVHNRVRRSYHYRPSTSQNSQQKDPILNNPPPASLYLPRQRSSHSRSDSDSGVVKVKTRPSRSWSASDSVLEKVGLGGLSDVDNIEEQFKHTAQGWLGSMNKWRRKLLPELDTTTTEQANSTQSDELEKWRTTEVQLRGSTTRTLLENFNQSRDWDKPDQYDYDQLKFEYYEAGRIEVRKQTTEKSTTAADFYDFFDDDSMELTTPSDLTILKRRYNEYLPNQTEVTRRFQKAIWKYWIKLNPICNFNLTLEALAEIGVGEKLQRIACASSKQMFGEQHKKRIKNALLSMWSPILLAPLILIFVWMCCCGCLCSYCPCSFCNPSKMREILTDVINRSQPGMRLYGDGTMEMYPPKPDEIEAFQELVEAIMEFK